MDECRINRIFSASLMTEGMFGLITATANITGYEFPDAVKIILTVIAAAALLF